MGNSIASVIPAEVPRIFVLVRIRAPDEAGAEKIIQAYKDTECVTKSRAEKGCIQYRLLQSVGRKRDLLLLEEYVSHDAFMTHSDEPHVQAVREALEGLMHEPSEVELYITIPVDHHHIPYEQETKPKVKEGEGNENDEEEVDEPEKMFVLSPFTAKDIQEAHYVKETSLDEEVLFAARKGPGVDQYIMLQHLDDKLKFTFVEEYADDASYEEHEGSAHWTKAKELIEKHASTPQRHLFREVLP